ncbi:MAG: MoaF N-terminal domain-containing protein [Oscillospiraceae bacterium]|jgi:hypothetical protein|nr:MoaF N-terminal domain-containing protein [Oscillospiraceae bacterium]
MDLRDFSKFGAGAFQYVPPRTFELAGQKFELLMDDGYDLVLNFLNKKEVEWNYVNKEPSSPQKAEYDALKGDDTTYFVTFMLEGRPFEHRENWVVIIDLEQMLVTQQRSVVGENPRWPYLVDSYFVFGAIKQDGVEFKSYPRHGFTSDMVGNIVQWQYSPDMATVHAYYTRDFYRITYPRNATTAEGAAQADSMNAMVGALPSSDEPAFYVRIKRGMYLVSCTEQNMEKLMGASTGFRSDNLTFLDNYNNCYDIGRGFGTMTGAGFGPPPDPDAPAAPPPADSNILVLIGAYAKIIDPSTDEFWQKILTDPNPYLVSNGQ